VNGDELIDEGHIKKALKRSRPVEEQIKERYGSYEGGVATDMTSAQKASSPYYHWNKHIYDDKMGYE
jgi:ATP-dependent Lon protease